MGGLTAFDNQRESTAQYCGTHARTVKSQNVWSKFLHLGITSANKINQTFLCICILNKASFKCSLDSFLHVSD